MENKIKAMFIFEILGRPPEHIKESLSQLIDKLGEFPGIKIENKKIHEPKPVENEKVKDFFTTFAEIEVSAEEINALINIIFNAMPSHVEIIEPNKIELNNFDLTNLLSSLTVKLHRYDEIAKTITIERNMLIAKLKELGVTFKAPEQKQEKQESSSKDKEKPIKDNKKDKEKSLKKEKKKILKTKEKKK
jgi:hypothetical protein